VSAVGKERKGGACGKAAKGAPTEGAGTPCKRKGAGRRKEIKESRGRRGGIMPYKCLGKISDILHPNTQNNQLKRRAQPP